MNKEDVVHIHMTEYYSAMKKNAVLLFLTTWMDLEHVIVNEVSQKEKCKYYMVALVCLI